MSTTKSTEDGEPWVYHGFPESNTTPIPDEFFDVIAPRLSEAELRVSLYVMRRTRGFKKTEDAISFSQLVGGITTRDGRVLDQGTGMSKSAVWRGVNGLVSKGILVKLTARSPLGDNETNVYRIHYRGDGGVVLQKNHPSSPKEPGVVLEENTQETVLQETVLDSSNTAAHSQSNPSAGETSKFRKGSGPVLEREKANAPNTEAPASGVEDQHASATRVPDAPELDTSEKGMTRLSQMLAAHGLAVHRAPEAAEAARQTTRSTHLSELPASPPTHRRDAASVPKAEQDVIRIYLVQSAEEFHDQAPKFTSTMTRVLRYYEQSALLLGPFTARMEAARRRTKADQAGGHIRKRGSAFAYFLSLLEEELGLREAPPEIAAAAKVRAEQAPPPKRKSLAGKYYDQVRH